jgi:hypothetical protein
MCYTPAIVATLSALNVLDNGMCDIQLVLRNFVTVGRCRKVCVWQRHALDDVGYLAHDPSLSFLLKEWAHHACQIFANLYADETIPPQG